MVYIEATLSMEATVCIQSFEFMVGSIYIYMMMIIYKVIYRVTCSTYKNEIYGRVPTIRGAPAHTAIRMIENQTAVHNFSSLPYVLSPTPKP